MTVKEELARSREVSNWIDTSIHSLQIESGDREVMAGALFDQVHEHHKAIQLLIQNSFVGSAFSLVRTTLETFVRGVWLLHCASEQEVKNFTEDKLVSKSFGDLIKEIEARPGYGTGVLSRVKKEAWQSMCSYAHGGYLQAARRITTEDIKPNYTDGEIVEVIRSSRAIALLTASEIFFMAKRVDLVGETIARMGGTSLIIE